MGPVNFYNTANELIRDVENDRAKLSAKRLAKFLGEHKPLSLNEGQIDRLKAVCHKYPNLKFVEKIVLKTEKVFQTVAKPRSEVFGHRTYLENIYQHLSPRDLVNLALTTKELGHSAPSFMPSFINSHPHKSMTNCGFKDLPEILRYLTVHGDKLTTLNLGDIKIDFPNLQVIVDACPNLQILTFLSDPPIFSESENDELDNQLAESRYYIELGKNISQLTHLKELTIRDCELDDKFLEKIKDLENLEKLVFEWESNNDDNEVYPEGIVTDFGLSILSDFKLLKYLILDEDFDVTTPNLMLALSKFEHLEDLTIWRFDADDEFDIRELLKLPNLKKLKNFSYDDRAFGVNILEDFDCLLGFENLEYLSLHQTLSEEDIVAISAHTQLKGLRFKGADYHSGRDLSKLSFLENFSCKDCFIEYTEHLAQMSNLKELEIGCILSHVDNLENVVDNLEIFLSHIEMLDNLEKIKLCNYWNSIEQNNVILDKFCRQKIAELQERRPNLKIEITKNFW